MHAVTRVAPPLRTALGASRKRSMYSKRCPLSATCSDARSIDRRRFLTVSAATMATPVLLAGCESVRTSDAAPARARPEGPGAAY